MSDKKLSVIIPARNEEDCLPRVIKELPRDIVDEILVVDGYSTDNTAKVVQELGVRVVTQEGGRGYGLGVETGIKYSTGDYLTFLDADGSYDPEALYRLRQGIEEGGNDVMFCSRYLPESGSDDDTAIRYVGNMFFSTMLKAMHGVRITDSLFLYIMTKREVFEKIQMSSTAFDWCIEFPIRVHRAGIAYGEIPSRERPRMAGVSKVNAFTDGLQILKKSLALKMGLDNRSLRSLHQRATTSESL